MYDYNLVTRLLYTTHNFSGPLQHSRLLRLDETKSDHCILTTRCCDTDSCNDRR